MTRGRMLCAGVASLWFACGCGGSANLGTVTGTVKLDGKPLDGAQVEFSPVAGGRLSAGRSDAQGKYELYFARDEKGALIGEHVVRITTYFEVDDGGKPRVTPEKLPTQYNVKSELKQEVRGGSNVIDFDLQGQGPVIQPGALEKASVRSSTC
ncbi:MAG: carboxypeptidase regulatory-like domain-containing protein [Pirellulaceae bacterium]